MGRAIPSHRSEPDAKPDSQVAYGFHLRCLKHQGRRMIRRREFPSPTYLCQTSYCSRRKPHKKICNFCVPKKWSRGKKKHHQIKTSNQLIVTRKLVSGPGQAVGTSVHCSHTSVEPLGTARFGLGTSFSRIRTWIIRRKCHGPMEKV